MARQKQATAHAGEAQCWIIFKTPDELPPLTTAKDWPDKFVARRFTQDLNNLLVPTEDLIHGPTLGDVRMRLPPLKVIARVPEDDDTIVETRITPRLEVVRFDERFTSGMKIREAMHLAAIWWDKTGRHMVDKEINTETTAARVSARSGMPVSIVKGDKMPTLPSGILQGLPWDALTDQEKARVLVTWHSEFHVKPGKARVRGHLELLLSGEVQSNG